MAIVFAAIIIAINTHLIFKMKKALKRAQKRMEEFKTKGLVAKAIGS